MTTRQPLEFSELNLEISELSDSLSNPDVWILELSDSDPSAHHGEDPKQLWQAVTVSPLQCLHTSVAWLISDTHGIINSVKALVVLVGLELFAPNWQTVNSTWIFF